MFQFTIIDDLVDDVYNNVTWGGKKSRYHYTCTLQSQSDLFENNDDSDQTESVHTDRIQSTSNNFIKVLNLIF